MKTITTIFTTLLLTATFMSTPAKATSNDYVVLESITAVNTTVLLGGNLEYELVVSSPSSFTWDPKGSNLDGKIMILLCEETIYLENTVPPSCDYKNQMSKYRLTEVHDEKSETIGNFRFYTFKIRGVPSINTLGKYFVYSVRIPNAKISDPEEYSLNYYFGRNDVLDSYFNLILVPTINFDQSFIDIVDKLVQEEPPQKEEAIDNIEEIVIPNTPTPPAAIQRPVASTVQAAPVAAPAIQSNFFLPAIKGDQYWRPLREVKGTFENWRVGKRNSLDGVPNRFTKTDGSLMTFTSRGDALTVRYMAGKKRGGFSIYVNGQFLDRVDANQKRKKILVKTWDGLGDGKHYIDIVAELSNDQSLAINGVQKLKK